MVCFVHLVPEVFLKVRFMLILVAIFVKKNLIKKKYFCLIISKIVYVFKHQATYGKNIF